MLRVLLFVVPLVLAIYALVDLVQTDDEQIQGLPKLAWVVLIVLIGFVGPLAWLIAGKKKGAGSRPRFPGIAGGRTGRADPPRGPVGPDDDPDFLRGLRPPKPHRPSDEDPPHTPA